ncbi:MAG: DUF4421 domain-containing protein, partial [Ferruginibacter sp.]
LLFCPGTLHAQSKKSYDPNYYNIFPKSVSARIFTSKKYSVITMQSITGKDLRYIANSNTAAGLGLSYNNLSANIAFGLPFLNDKDKGKTKVIDLQAHLYSRRWINDLYAQQYRGYYTTPANYPSTTDAYYYRPDLKVQLLGFNRYRVFNSRRFSYRASFLQTEWQKKSAGTLLAGFEMYYSRVKADSSFIPFNIKANYRNPGVLKLGYASIGPGIGYAYTLVIDQHFFATASVIGNLNFNYVKEFETASSASRIGIDPLLNFRVAAGYNGRVWSVAANWIAANLNFKGSSGGRYLEQTGNYRFIVSRRFKAGKKLQKKLRAMDNFFKEGKEMLPASLGK